MERGEVDVKKRRKTRTKEQQRSSEDHYIQSGGAVVPITYSVAAGEQRL